MVTAFRPARTESSWTRSILCPGPRATTRLGGSPTPGSGAWRCGSSTLSDPMCFQRDGGPAQTKPCGSVSPPCPMLVSPGGRSPPPSGNSSISSPKIPIAKTWSSKHATSHICRIGRANSAFPWSATRPIPRQCPQSRVDANCPPLSLLDPTFVPAVAKGLVVVCRRLRGNSEED